MQQQKVNKSSLASTYVDTPDPLQDCPPCAQRLVISWDCSQYKGKEELYLQGTIIFCDLSEEKVIKPICKTISSTDFYFPLDPNNKNPIMSYKIEIVSEDGQVIDTWKHKLWVKPLLIEELE